MRTPYEIENNLFYDDDTDSYYPIPENIDEIYLNLGFDTDLKSDEGKRIKESLIKDIIEERRRKECIKNMKYSNRKKC